MRIKTILTLFFLLATTMGFSQTVVYIAPNGKRLTAAAYQQGKITSLANARKNYGADYELYEKIELLKKTDDSIQYQFKWEFLNKELFAEQLVTDQLLGTELLIKDLNFVKRTGQKFDFEKPTMVNFWFTNCIPCIEELPALNALKQKYKDSINFIAITFDDQQKVDLFLAQHQFDFMHVVNQKKLIDQLGIIGFPKSFLLDKNQKIQFITGALPAVANQQAYVQQLRALTEKLNQLR